MGPPDSWTSWAQVGLPTHLHVEGHSEADMSSAGDRSVQHQRDVLASAASSEAFI
jgi:hypothetical protein